MSTCDAETLLSMGSALQGLTQRQIDIIKAQLLCEIYSAGVGGGGTWGSITGTLSDQTDLQTALDAKAEFLGSYTTAALPTGALGNMAWCSDCINTGGTTGAFVIRDGSQWVLAGEPTIRATTSPVTFALDVFRGGSLSTLVGSDIQVADGMAGSSLPGQLSSGTVGQGFSATSGVPYPLIGRLSLTPLTGYVLNSPFATNVQGNCLTGVHILWFSGFFTDGDATNDVLNTFGWQANAHGDTATGVYFRRNYNVNGGRWQCVHRSGAADDVATDSGVSDIGSASSLVNLLVAVNQTTAVFVINGSVVATETPGGNLTTYLSSHFPSVKSSRLAGDGATYKGHTIHSLGLIVLPNITAL